MVEEKTPSKATSYTHTGLMAGTGMCYRVFSVNVVGTSTDFAGHGDGYVIVSDNDAGNDRPGRGSGHAHGSDCHRG